MSDLRPPIPASCADRPVVGGLVAPYANVRLSDGGVDFRSPDNAAYERCWRRGLCQTCGRPIRGGLAVLFGGPNQFGSARFDEPPLCPPCAVYASQACPMVAGRSTHYADREPLAAGRRGERCGKPDCDCPGWTYTEPDTAAHEGEPAHPWYAAYVRPGGWRLTARIVPTACTDDSCDRLHDRTVIAGCLLTAMPVKVFLVSAPGEGRIWRRLTGDETAALMEAS